MCVLHGPKQSKKEKDGKPLSFGVFGRTDRFDEVPQWDLGPHPCDGWDDSMPHGGKDSDLCDIWKDVVKTFPPIHG